MKLEKDHAVIETAEEAGAVYPDFFAMYQFVGVSDYKVPRAEVLEAITPKKGDAVFWWGEYSDDENDPDYIVAPFPFNPADHLTKVKANAITTARTVGELRALLTWARG